MSTFVLPTDRLTDRPPSLCQNTMGSLPSPPPDLLRVAIVGAGPAGLGAAIALSKLPNIEVNIYEKATELSEVGAGIRIGYNGWKVLGLLGAADGVRGHHKINVLHR
jgi:salicylate hydroxylase